MNAWRLGLAFNYYSENNLNRFSFLFNGGFKFYKDNNTSKLSTTAITQEVVTKNSSGDTTRKISKTYNAYTDKIDDMQAFELFSNFYLLKGSRRASIHLFPAINTTIMGQAII